MSSNAPSSTSNAHPAWLLTWLQRLPGLALCAALAAAASFVAGLHGATMPGPVMLYALVFGSAFHYQSSEPHSAPGIAWSSGTMLRLGIGLLGARITAEQIGGLGAGTLLLVAAGVASTLAIGWMASKVLGQSRSLGILAGGATAICGASAALALAAVLPRDERSDRDTLNVVVIATLLSTAAMFGYPLLARALQLSPAAAGLFIGGSIQDVAQVIVAGYSLGPASGDAATLVKLLRVSMLVLVVGLVSQGTAQQVKRNAAQDATAGSTQERESAAVPRSSGVAPRRQPLLPWFIALFAALIGLRSLGALPLPLIGLLDQSSRACLLIGVAAWGAKTSLPALARCGWRPLLLMLLCASWLAGLMLAAALLMPA